MHDEKTKLSIAVIICIVVISLGYGVGLFLEPLHITLQRSGDTLEIIPIIDGKPPIECPEGYRIKAVGYYDDKINYRCLLIQYEEDCLETETYFKKTMTCVPKPTDHYRLECGDRYFLDSDCHEKYVKNNDTEKYSNERGEFYIYQNGVGIISSQPKNYASVSLLIPIESDDACTFKKQFGYSWCGNYFGDKGDRPYSVDVCVEYNFNGVRITDGYCLEILVMDYVDDFNNAYKEQKLRFVDWKIFDDRSNEGVKVT